MFTLFGFAHILALCIIGSTATAIIISYRAGYDNSKKHLHQALAICCLLSYPLQILFSYLGNYPLTLENKLPLHLCDIAAIVCGLALLTKHPRLLELAYFWGLAGTLQGLLTPNLQQDVPPLHFTSFFWNHGFVVITALFIPLALRWRPEKHAIWRVFAITQVYVVIAALGNYLLKGTNYGYLHHKPEQASLLDIFPAWPWYILILELLCLVLFFLLILPFSIKSHK